MKDDSYCLIGREENNCGSGDCLGCEYWKTTYERKTEDFDNSFFERISDEELKICYIEIVANPDNKSDRAHFHYEQYEHRHLINFGVFCNCLMTEMARRWALKRVPTEDDIIKVILDSVSIRGIELEHYKREFTDERSGLITNLLKLFGYEKK